jgi:hypothetical protein
MKRAALFSLLFSAAVFAGPGKPNQAMAATTPAPLAVVIISCVGNPLATPTPANYVVATVDMSPSSPPIPTSGSCATAIATGLSSGLIIRNIAHGANDMVIVYTLRTAHKNEQDQ